MEPVNEHPWNLDVEEALLLQQKLATCVISKKIHCRKLKRLPASMLPTTPSPMH